MPPKIRRVERRPQYETPSYRTLCRRLSTNLRRLREANEWSQERAGEACAMSSQHYQQIESGQTNITLVVLARLADGFGVDSTELIASTRKR